MNISPGARIQLLGPALIAILVVTFLVGLSALGLGMIPPQPSDLQWRYTQEMQVLSSGPMMSLILAMVMLTAIHGGHYRAVRLSAIVAFLIAAVLIVITPLFTLDVLAAKRLQPGSAAGHFLREGLRLASVSVVIGAVLAWAGWRAWLASVSDVGPRKSQGGDLVVAQSETPR